eukprot:TRINITY_DN1850_c0_g1_i1.p1 TRINITY_DN1850_c0_g1~~TRINITY_DN1850_c0_g1_i1.p1  ORF type:complete len:109 (+),score=19.88 TRINITY_DN1850_c0_g1_i1:566-892(+)
MKRQKAPKIQRLVTEARLRRKRIHKQEKIKRWKRTIELTQQYKKLHDTWASKKREALRIKRKASREEPQTKPAETKQQPKQAVPKTVNPPKKATEQPKPAKTQAPKKK